MIIKKSLIIKYQARYGDLTICFLQKIKIFENHQNYKNARTCKNFSLERKI